MPDPPTPGNTLRRKRVVSALDFNGTRPASFVLLDSGPRLLILWKEGRRIRQLARNHGTTVNDMEDILRRAA